MIGRIEVRADAADMRRAAARTTSAQHLTTSPLVDVFATGTTTDPDNPGGFSLVPDSQQDAATQQVYSAAMAAVPEPSTGILAATGIAVMGLARAWRCNKRWIAH